MRCEYCFYSRVEEMYTKRPHRMAEDVLERMIEDFVSHRFPVSVFSWQGGEPTLAGLDFFEQVIELEKKHGEKGQVMGNSLQTNGLLIDEEWASFLAKYKFLVGVSLDGPQSVHDIYRKQSGVASTWQRTMDCIGLLNRHGVAFSVLCVVSKANAADAAKLYRWLIGNGLRNLQFIPCVEMNGENGRISDSSVGPMEYGDFLIDVFDEWKKRDVGRVFVRTFDSILTYLGSGQHMLCTFGGSCHDYLVVEHNGDVYPCDFFVKDEWKLGNVMDAPLASFLESDKAKGFAAEKENYSEKCAACRWVELCNGGCQKDRIGTDGAPVDRSYLCAGYEKFFSHTRRDFEKIRKRLMKAARKGARAIKVVEK